MTTSKPKAKSSPPGFLHERGFRLLVISGLVLLSLFVALLITVRVQNGPTAIDTALQQWMLSLRSNSLTTFFEHITALASSEAIIMLLGISSIALLLQRHYRLTGLIIVLFAGEGLITSILKKSVNRVRPDADSALVLETSHSFPSGHTMAAVLCWGLLAYIVYRCVQSKSGRALVIFGYVFLVGAVGVSRIYLGAHYLTDVLGSILLGSGILTLLIAGLVNKAASLPKRFFNHQVAATITLAFAVVTIATFVWPVYFD